MRSETRFSLGTLGAPQGARAQVATEYRAEPRLAMWVPAEIREECAFGSRAEATARYSSFRKFTVTVEDETATPPPEAPAARPEP